MIYIPSNKTQVQMNTQYQNSNYVHLLSQSFHKQYSQPWQLLDNRYQENKWVVLDKSTLLNGEFKLFYNDKNFKKQNLIGQFSNTLSNYDPINGIIVFSPPVMFYLMFDKQHIVDEIKITFDDELNEYQTSIEIQLLNEQMNPIFSQVIYNNSVTCVISMDQVDEQLWLNTKFIKFSLLGWNIAGRMQKIHEIELQTRFYDDISNLEYHLSTLFQQQSQQVSLKNQHPLSTPEMLLVNSTQDGLMSQQFLDQPLSLNSNLQPPIQQIKENRRIYYQMGVFSQEKQKQNKRFNNPLTIYVTFQNPQKIRYIRVVFDIYRQEYQPEFDVVLYKHDQIQEQTQENIETIHITDVTSPTYIIQLENEVLCKQFQIVVKSWSVAQRVQKVIKLQFWSSNNTPPGQQSQQTFEYFIPIDTICPKNHRFYIGLNITPLNPIMYDKEFLVYFEQIVDNGNIIKDVYIHQQSQNQQIQQFIIEQNQLKQIKVKIVYYHNDINQLNLQDQLQQEYFKINVLVKLIKVE